MYETGTALQVRAFHVMPGMPPPEGERHAHDYRLDVVVRRDDLDDRGMVVDLDLLDGALRDAAAQVDGADLEQIRPADAEAVTVEVFAEWLHRELLLEQFTWAACAQRCLAAYEEVLAPRGQSGAV